jgi:hypothetical protein
MPAISSSPGEGIRAALDDEARRLLAAAATNALPLGLLGGMGIRLLLGARLEPRLRREIGDLDFITTRRASAPVEALLAAAGWEPERRFNAINGSRRLLFNEPRGTRRVDVFVGSFQMCHRLPLLDALDGRAQVLPAADLALTKLQIVALNDKDREDLYALLLACEVVDRDTDADPDRDAGTDPDRDTDADPDRDAGTDPDRDTDAGDAPAIDARRIATLAGADWGLCHTLQLNLARLRAGLSATDLAAAQRELLQRRIAALDNALERAPKSRAWRLRARVGERRPWFEEPEEIAR